MSFSFSIMTVMHPRDAEKIVWKEPGSTIICHCCILIEPTGRLEVHMITCILEKCIYIPFSNNQDGHRLSD